MILITGGFNGDSLASCEVLGSPSCHVPDLPTPRWTRITALTSDGLILSCGGIDDLSCVSLDTLAQTWTEHSTLNTDRFNAQSVSLPEGLFILGGKGLGPTSSYLATGSTQWTAGPTLPYSASDHCAVAITEHKFLIIGGDYGRDRNVVEYDITTASWTDWPPLQIGRRHHACARLGDNIIIAGGLSEDVSSTTILSLANGEQRHGQHMTSARYDFGMAQLGGRLLAFGGWDGNGYTDSVEEWDGELEQWMVREERLKEGRDSFGFVSSTVNKVCNM